MGYLPYRGGRRILWNKSLLVWLAAAAFLWLWKDGIVEVARFMGRFLH